MNAVALNRLDSIVKDRIRNQIASRTLVEVISEQRVTTMQDIAREANIAAAEFGIEVVDVRIKAIELPDDVRESVFRRMAADRQKEANLYRFEGRESAERIRADADREVQVILAEAERDGQTLRGEGDASLNGDLCRSFWPRTRSFTRSPQPAGLWQFFRRQQRCDGAESDVEFL